MGRRCIVNERASAADAARLQADEQFRVLFERAPIGMGLAAPGGRWIRVNAAMCAMTGYSEEELLAMTYIDITHPDDVAATLEQITRLADGDVDGYQVEKRYITSEGDVLWILASVSLTHDRDDGSPLLIAHLVDISDRKRLEARLRFLADHDPLTGLRNRRAFAQDLLVQIGRCQRYGEQAALLMLDLDGFKAMNDRHGHTAGDDVLKAVSNTLMGQVRSSDIVARLGGDEFAVLVAHAARDHAEAVAEHIRVAVAAIAVPANGATLRPAVSIGIAPIDEDTRSDEDVLAAADSAMYRAKRGAAGEPDPEPAPGA